LLNKFDGAKWRKEVSMPKQVSAGCARPAGGPVDEVVDVTMEKQQNVRKEEMKMIKVGKKAPDFTAPGYHEGKFVNVKLSDYQGKWVLLCFYPGDFTFV